MKFARFHHKGEPCGIIKKVIGDDRSVSIGGTAFDICRVLFDMTETGIAERQKNAPAASAKARQGWPEPAQLTRS
jgi:hypothetical protein